METQKTVEIPMEVFDRLMEFFDRWHQSSFDPKFVGQTGKKGEQCMRDLFDIATENAIPMPHVDAPAY
jgi:hypothetical protein